MLRHARIIIAIILVMLLVALSGCNPTSLRYDKQYIEYAFVNIESSFVPTGRKLTINSNNTFSMIFSEDLTLTGTAEHKLREQTIYLDMDENTSTVVKERLKQKFLSDPNNAMPIEIIDMILDGLDISEQVYYYKQYMFSVNFINAHRYIDTSLYHLGQDYSQFEGVYSVKDYDGLMLLKHGEIYIQDPVKPVTGQFPVKAGSYILANDFVTMTINDSSGNPRPAQKYLVADLILPFDLRTDATLNPDAEEISEDQWYKDIEDQLEGLKGQKIKVLVLAFYTRGKI